MASVEIRCEPIEILTYAWGPPDPNPPFQRDGSWSIYPYPLLDDLGTDARPVRYRSLVLENEYLRVTVLPELGGRLHSAVHKPTGEEVFYRNNVVKPGLIALRGAWLSGGIEWNFPRGHTVTGVSHIDSRAVQEPDGSATIWVSNVEQIFRMAWAVGIRLRPASARVETEIVLSNRTALPHPYYFWANVAVPARDDMRMIYPGTRAFTWRDPKVDWPVHEGRDIARYTAYPSANDVFIIDSLEDFFGVYYDDRDFGVIHVADVNYSFGKKFFTWGTAHHGKVWSAALSDGDGPYCEVQSGRFRDQATWRHMPPHHTERWLEWWYPIAGMGGFARANAEAALRLSSDGRSVDAGIAVTRPQPGARLRLMAGDRALHEREVDLSPERPLQLNLEVGERPAGAPLTLVVESAAGAEIIRLTEGQPPRTATVREEPKRRDATAGELARSALRAEERGDFDRAMQLYRQALDLDAACLEAAVALGRLAIERSPEKSVEILSQAAAAAPESVEVAYYLGVALVRAGRDVEAEVELHRAAHRPEFAHAAHFELGLIAMRCERWEQASELLELALGSQSEDGRARAMLAAALRRGGRADEALRQLRESEGERPFDRLIAAETHFCAAACGHPRIAARYMRILKEMLPDETDPWLELALDYVAAGLHREAADLLSWATARVRAVRRCPLIQYTLAHCLQQLGDSEEARAARGRAKQIPAEGVFAHHWELEPMLREATSSDPEDAAAGYHLGCLLYGQGRREEAIEEWEAAALGAPEFAVGRRNLALAYRQVRDDLEGAESELRAAVAASPGDVRLYLELNDVLKARGAAAAERLAALDAAPEEVQRRGAIAAQQIMCCIQLEEWGRAISLLRTHTFHRWEMEFRMRRVYLDACLGRGTARLDGGDFQGAREDFELALEYPMNIRIGRPAHPRDARAHWCAAAACEALGDLAAAKKHWESAAAETYHHPGSDLALYRALSLKKLGRYDESDAALGEALDLAQKCADMAPDDATAQFSLALTLIALDRKGEAEAPLARALELDPGSRRAKRLAEGKPIL